MSYTTIGIDINATSIRYAVCSVSGLNVPVNVLELSSVAIESGEDDNVLRKGLEELSSRLEKYKKLQVDAIGLALDPTVSMSLHKVMPFNDPKIIEQVLPQNLMDIWNVNDSTQISFEVGKKIPGKPGAEGEEAEDGYDIHAINYPREPLAKILGLMKEAQLDPHVAIPATEALNYSVKTVLTPDCPVWCMLDIGDTTSMLAVVVNGEVELTRSFKLGSSGVDESLMNAFNLSAAAAKVLKEQSGFLAVPGRERQVYDKNMAAGRIAPTELNPVELSEACSHGFEVLLTAVRQTLSNFVATSRIEPECVYLCGGGSKICGLAEWLSALFEVRCVVGMPVSKTISQSIINDLAMDIDAVSVAVAAAANIDGLCPLNLRRGTLAHKGSLAYLQDHKWLIACCVLAVIISLVFMFSTKEKAIKAEHDRLKATLEETTQNVFGKKMLNYKQIEAEISSSVGFEFIPVRTAFTHFAWISMNVNDNLADVEMDLNSLDIDTQRKIVTIRGEVSGDDGLPRFMQLLETYECFPDEIQEPKTSKKNGRTSFTLRIDANHCKMGGDSE
ncbi:MAG: rod shape-determining protein [Proteobacteria bacterium]|nr:rod shape-determining protein [Pseudomonadota bacterium]